MPALAEAAKIGAKAAKAGFDWPHWRDLLPKLAEETAELEAEAAAAESSGSAERKAAVEAELGDLLFTVVNLGRHLGVDAEMALTLEDVVMRRTGVGQLGEPSAAALHTTASLMASEFGWNADRIGSEIATVKSNFRTQESA